MTSLVCLALIIFKICQSTVPRNRYLSINRKFHRFVYPKFQVWYFVASCLCTETIYPLYPFSLVSGHRKKAWDTSGGSEMKEPAQKLEPLDLAAAAAVKGQRTKD